MRDERGAGSVLALAMTGVVVLVAFAVLGIGALVATHRLAQSAADLAALAGAQTLQGGGDPCARAAEVARRNGATLQGCRVEGWNLAVTVVRSSPRLLGQVFQQRARSRAGPAAPERGARWSAHSSESERVSSRL